MRKRLPKRRAWLGVLLSPLLGYLQPIFNAFMAAQTYYLLHNSQVCKMQAALNDTFDDALRRIFISDPVTDNPVWLYMRSEDKPVYLYRRSENKPVYLYRRSEIGGTGTQFIVNVPSALGLTSGQVAQLTALVNRDRLPSKRNWIIVYF